MTAFDAAIMAVAAYVQTGGRFAVTPEHLILWGSAVAAAICAVVVFVEGSSLIAWAAIGYIVFGALLTGVPEWPLVALAAALMPLVPRPRGSFVYGLSALFSQECTVKDGAIVQSNFHDYNSMRIAQMPKVESIVMPSGGFWGGVGEPTICVAPPAVLNAIFAATGKRLRSIPLKNHGLTIA